MHVKQLTKPPFLALTPGTWFIVRLDGPMSEIVLPKQPAPAKVYPVSLYHTGPLPLPDSANLFGFLVRQGSQALLPANHALAEAFDVSDAVGAYFQLTYNGQKTSGGRKFNLWDVSRLELDQAEKDTLDGKG